MSVPTAPEGAPASSLIALSTGVLAALRTGALLSVACTLSENSEVSFVLRSVAVAEIHSPTPTLDSSAALIATLVVTVVTLTEPR